METLAIDRIRSAIWSIGAWLRSRWPLLVIIAIASILRLSSLDLIDFRFDEASAPQFALSIVNGNWLSVAPFSGSIANHPPVFLYVLAIPYLFTHDLLVVAAFRAMLDVCAILLLWFLCDRHFSRLVSVFACAFFAVAPWAVQLSRKLSIEEISLFTVLLLFGLLELVHRKNSWGWVLSGWGLALSVGTHLTAIFLIPVTIVAWILSIKTKHLARMILGIFPIVLLALIYLQYDSMHDFTNIRSLLTATQGTSSPTLDSVQFAAWISGGMHIADLTAGAYPMWQSQLPVNLDLIDTLQVMLLGIGVLWVLFQLVIALRRHDNQSVKLLTILLLWASIPILLQLQHSKPMQIHYVTPLYPIPFILMALPSNALFKWYRANPRNVLRVLSAGMAVGCISLILVWQVVTTFRLIDFIEKFDTSIGGYGLPVRSAYNVARLAQDGLCVDSYCQIRNTPADTIVVAPGGDSLVNEQATILNVLLAGSPHRFANSDAGLIIPSSTAQYIFAPGTENALQALLNNIEGGNIISKTYAVRSGYPLAYTYIKTSEPLAHHFLATTEAHWANGVDLAGYRSISGASLHLEVLLHVSSVAFTTNDYHWYNHVMDNGRKVSQFDGGGISPGNWREGDILLQWFDIPLSSPSPALPYVVRIGSYEYPTITSVPVQLGDGTLADGVDLVVK